MQASIQKLKTFLLHDMWQINLEEISRSKFIMVTILKKLYLTISHFFTKGTIDYAGRFQHANALTIAKLKNIFIKAFKWTTKIQFFSRTTIYFVCDLSYILMTYIIKRR